MDNKSNLSREDWLTEAAHMIVSDIIAPHMPEGWTMPAFRVTVSEPDSRNKGKTIAKCFNRNISADNTNEIFVSAVLRDSVRILDCVAHELIHALDNLESGHGGEFKRVARAIGLVGPLTATVAGDSLASELRAIVDTLGGDIPHAALDITRKPKQAGRNLKVACSAGCGFRFNTSKKQIAMMADGAGGGICPACGDGVMALAN